MIKFESFGPDHFLQSKRFTNFAILDDSANIYNTEISTSFTDLGQNIDVLDFSEIIYSNIFAT